MIKMEQLQTSQPSQVLPQIIEVYQETVTESAKIQSPQIIHISHPSLQSTNGTITYQQSQPTQHMQGPSQILQSQMQTLQSCSQIHLQATSVPQVLQHQDLSAPTLQPLQITQHVITLPVFKQHMSDLTQQYYGQYQCQKDNSLVPKVEPDVQNANVNKSECKVEITLQNHSDADASTIQADAKPTKRNRSSIPDPSKWACNVRKYKHQRGEAYISRRGKYVPERRVKNTKDCLKTCKYKCNEHITDMDREHIFKAFYSLSANEKKHFLLNTTERDYTKRLKNNSEERSKRKYSFKYFFLVRAVRYTVCKNFYLGTLAISQKPVYNVHLGKSEVNVPKPDGRGMSEASAHAVPSEQKERVRNHIMSFTTFDGKPIKPNSLKKQYLEASLSIKQMYAMYVNQCQKENTVAVKESMYRKIFKLDFKLNFKKIKREQVLCCRCKGPVKNK